MVVLKVFGTVACAWFVTPIVASGACTLDFPI